MTCAETRRQLPEPEPTNLARVTEHIALCPPCRIEQEALREVDRRLDQLGEHRLTAASQFLSAVQSPAFPLRQKTPQPVSIWRVAFAALLGILFVFGTLLFLFRWK